MEFFCEKTPSVVPYSLSLPSIESEATARSGYRSSGQWLSGAASSYGQQLTAAFQNLRLAFDKPFGGFRLFVE